VTSFLRFFFHLNSASGSISVVSASMLSSNKSAKLFIISSIVAPVALAILLSLLTVDILPPN
jgi:hypothetical protein